MLRIVTACCLEFGSGDICTTTEAGTDLVKANLSPMKAASRRVIAIS